MDLTRQLRMRGRRVVELGLHYYFLSVDDNNNNNDDDGDDNGDFDNNIDGDDNAADAADFDDRSYMTDYICRLWHWRCWYFRSRMWRPRASHRPGNRPGAPKR